jgi:hypothetical protein
MLLDLIKKIQIGALLSNLLKYAPVIIVIAKCLQMVSDEIKRIDKASPANEEVSNS